MTQQFTITSATSWVCPANVTSVFVECWGGGGGGGGGPTGAGGAAGGGGGAYANSTISVTAGTSYTVTVGTGGIAGLNAGSTNGGTGGDSWFNTTGTVLAKGGGGGGFGAAGSAGTGGAAGSSVGTVTNSGGNGGGGNGTSGNFGSGGGGSAGSVSPGGVGGTATISAAGAAGNAGAVIGGVGGAGSSGAGSPGLAPGGAGAGGAGAGTNGAAGSAGLVQLTYTVNGVPSNNNDFTVFNAYQYGNISIDDGDYFIQKGTQYLITEYKSKHQNNSDSINFTWKGRSTISTSVSPLLIQIFNVNSGLWETLRTQTVVPADTDFIMSVSQTVNVSNYYDSSDTVTFRSYQQVI